MSNAPQKGNSYWIKLLPLSAQRGIRKFAWGIYVLGLAAVAILLRLGNIFVDPGSPLLVTRVRIGPGYMAYGLCLIVITTAALYNFRLGAQFGVGSHHRYFLAATLVSAVIILAGYITTALSLTPSLPRLAQDIPLLVALSLLGYAVAMHQALVERQTTLEDFPISGLTILGLTGIYTLAAWQHGFRVEELVFVAGLAILTHSTYDLIRELLDRLLHRHKSVLRRQLRELARNISGEKTLPNSLHRGLSLLCRALHASGGFFALKQGEYFVVSASVKSLGLGSRLEAPEMTCDDVRQPTLTLAQEVMWLAPAFVGRDQAGVVGLGPRTTQHDYSEADLDLLAEIADWVGLMISTHAQQQASQERLTQLAADAQSRRGDPRAEVENLIVAFEKDLDATFVRSVEEGLRQISDYATLGQTSLASRLGVKGQTHIERGKVIRRLLTEAVESLRPAHKRPPEPLPREWHSYVILHDAYIEDVPNREIMARLYISEGTFNRQRRKALRAIARHLLEMKGEASSMRTPDKSDDLGA